MRRARKRRQVHHADHRAAPAEEFPIHAPSVAGATGNWQLIRDGIWIVRDQIFCA
jgi:hypothetical protein